MNAIYNTAKLLLNYCSESSLLFYFSFHLGMVGIGTFVALPRPLKDPNGRRYEDSLPEGRKEFQLSTTIDYIQHWTGQQALDEYIQNWYDQCEKSARLFGEQGWQDHIYVRMQKSDVSGAGGKVTLWQVTYDLKSSGSKHKLGWLLHNSSLGKLVLCNYSSRIYPA